MKRIWIRLKYFILDLKWEIEERWIRATKNIPANSEELEELRAFYGRYFLYRQKRFKEINS